MLERCSCCGPSEDGVVSRREWVIPLNHHGRVQAIDQSLKALSTSRVDLMLMHAPGDPDVREETWRALEDAHKEVTVVTLLNRF